MDTNLIVALILLLVATALLALLSAAEAAVTSITRGRVRQAQANSGAGALRELIGQRYRILHTLSAGTAAVLVAGAVTFAFVAFRDRQLSPAGAVLVALLALLAAAVLRQTARAVVLINPELAGITLARPIRWLTLLFAPLAWVANAPSAIALRLLGRRSGPREPDLAGELLAVLEADGDPDASLQEERRMMRGILAMADQTVREIMSPRMDILAVSTDASVGDVMKLINESGFSRIPLYEDSVDHIIGVLYAKDLLAYLERGELQPDLREIARPPYFVPETKRANELLSELRRDQVHLAIAVDEYGGTAGVVTVEDLLEEIVGEIADEYDTEEMELQQISDDEWIVDARLPLDDLNELFGTSIESEDFDTVGGLIFSLLGRLATPGDEVVSADHGLRLRVLTILGRRIKRVRVVRAEPTASEEEEQAAAV